MNYYFSILFLLSFKKDINGTLIIPNYTLVHGTYWRIGIKIEEILVEIEVILLLILTLSRTIRRYLLNFNYIYKKRRNFAYKGLRCSFRT